MSSIKRSTKSHMFFFLAFYMRYVYHLLVHEVNGESIEMIRHEENKWVLYTHDGSHVLGTHDTKEEAIAQEQAILAQRLRKGLQGILQLVGVAAEKVIEKLRIFTR